MSYDHNQRTIDCDGGGWTGCNNYVRVTSGVGLGKTRQDMKRRGWHYIMGVDRKMYDFCPACGMYL